MAKGSGGYYYKLNSASARGGAASSAADGTAKGVAAAPAATSIKEESANVKTTDVPATKSKEEMDAEKEEEKKKKKAEEIKNKANLTRLWGMLEGHHFPFFVGTIGGMCVGCAGPFIGLVFVKAMAPLFSLDPSEVWSAALQWSLVMFGASLVQIVGDTARGWGFCVPGERLTVKLRVMFYDALVRQDIGWHDLPENSSGALCAALATEVTTIHALLGESLGKNVTFLFTVLSGFGLAFVCGYWEVALWALLMVPIMGITMAFEIATIQGATSGQQGAGLSGSAGRIVGEAMSSVRTVASFCMEKVLTAEFEAATDSNLKVTLGKTTMASFFAGLSQGSMFGAFALLYRQGSMYAADAEKALPMGAESPMEAMFTPIFVFFLMAAGMGQAFNGATDTSKASAAAGRVFEAFDRRSTIDFTSETGQKPSAIVGKIQFQDVTFAYPSRRDQVVCNGYNLTVEAGTTVALVGASGSGKSTAVSLVERFYDPDQGSVTLDGVDLRELNVRWLRQQIGLVGQEPVLFSGTIADNIGEAWCGMWSVPGLVCCVRVSLAPPGSVELWLRVGGASAIVCRAAFDGERTDAWGGRLQATAGPGPRGQRLRRRPGWRTRMGSSWTSRRGLTRTWGRREGSCRAGKNRGWR
jgi:ATP-binding cassette subfamily B (MDR/TAP) protein 1